ncbi:MAG: PilZ domain-containing protein [Pirellulaceae bacterium]|nr:PilZ domain-containing protein [Pirellulaceae bacterium]
MPSLIDRLEPRFDLDGRQEVNVTVEPDGHRDSPLLLVGKLMNLSSRGAKLAVPKLLPIGRKLRVKVSIERLAMELHTLATVCWISPEKAEESVVGCRLSPAIPEGIMSHLAAGGKLERREATRDEDHCRVPILRAGGNAMNPEWARLQNYSTGGFCLQTTRPANLGERVQFVLDAAKNVVIQAVVRWQLGQGDHYLLGCGHEPNQPVAAGATGDSRPR